jgi:hypothetical protein
MIRQHLKFLGMLFALSILVGCSSAGSSGSGSSPAPTATLSANPTSFTVGNGASALSFTSTNATQGSIDNGVGPVGTNGTVQVTPAATTTYTFTATGPGGTTTAQATVTVNPLGPAPTISLQATPAAVIAGQPVTLTWSSSNATSVVIQPSPGAVQLSGSGTVFPTADITYTATATGNYQQTTISQTVTVSPLNSADGMLPDSTNAGQQDIDPNGAVGTKQYLEYVNIEFQAFDKTTLAPVAIGGISGPQPIGMPWTNTLNAGDISNCDGHAVSGVPSGIQLDAVIDFDRLANRWVIMGKADFSNAYYLCLAVSNTDDLTSNTLGWYGYELPLDPFINQNNGKYHFPDWSKLGIWQDGYYVTMDLQDVTESDAEVEVAVCVFDRNDILLQGSSSPPPVLTPACANVPVTVDLSSGTFLGHSLIPADIDGTTAPPAGRDEFMVSIENPSIASGSLTSTTFNLWDFHADWSSNPPALIIGPQTTPSVPVYTPGCYLFVPGFPAITNCVTEQPYTSGGQTTGQTIDSVGDRFMPRFAYRNFGTYESFLVSHTIQTGPGENSGLPNPLQTGVRWYELRATVNGSSATCDSGTVTLGVTPVVCQTGTINPDALLFRFLPSIAQDKDGNAAVGYSYSNSFTPPGMAFSYWDLGTLNATSSEISIFEGPAQEVTTDPPYPVAGRGQWGSYSSMTVDPSDDCTFWYVNEYWPTNFNWATRISNFKVPTCQ